MGVDWYTCDWCEKCIPDCASVTLEFTNTECISVCENCADELKKSGIIIPNQEEPEWGYLRFCEERKFYSNWSEFTAETSDSKIHKVGFWKKDPEYIDPHMLGSLLNDPNCGTSKEELKEIVEKILARSPRVRRGYGGKTYEEKREIYFGVKGYSYTERAEYNWKADQEKYTNSISVSSVEQVMEDLDRFLILKELPSTPILVIGFGTKYSAKYLEYFCFPDRRRHVSMFDSMEELIAAKWSWEESTYDTIWIANDKYFDTLIENAEYKINQLNDKIEEYRTARSKE